jgi:pimeloyl-ACP methyl ester carboxylesterase
MTAATTVSAYPRLYAERSGTGQPLVLLHGLGESSVGWRPVTELLAAEYDVIALDLPGFGKSPALPSRMAPTAVNLARAIEATLDELGVESYHVAGYSLGGRVAIELARSERVRSVVAISPDGLGSPVERVQGFVALVAGRGMALALAPAAALLSTTPAGRSVFFAGSRSFPWQLAPADARQLLTDYATSPAYDAVNWISMFDMPTGLNGIGQPALFLQGTADPLMAQQIMRYVNLIPNAKLQWLPCLNHVPISDNPRAVAGQMLAFLATAAAPLASTAS